MKNKLHMDKHGRTCIKQLYPKRLYQFIQSEILSDKYKKHSKITAKN